MTKLLRIATLAALLVAGLSAPASAQTDDRILNDAFAILRVDALLARSRQVCLDYSGIDLSDQHLAWTRRNVDVLERAEGLLETRTERLEPGMIEAMRAAASEEADTSFSREADKPAFCGGVGDAMESVSTDLTTWLPRETTRIAEAEAGGWPLLDLTDSQPVADAMAVKQHAFAMNDILVRCGTLFPPDDIYENARSEWEARNSFALDLADRVLANWGALHPRRWEEARDAAGSEVDLLVADMGAFETHCGALVPRIVDGAEDLDQIWPDLYDSVWTNAEIVP